jgi:FKBP-type peptidyl-prolyl cis-trans isomerase
MLARHVSGTGTLNRTRRKVNTAAAPATVSLTREVVMRRAAALLAIPLIATVATVAIAGCASSPSSSSPSSSKSGSSSASPSGSASASASGPTVASNSVVTASGAFDKTPTVTIPPERAASALYTKTLIQGTGPTLTNKESLLGNFVLYDWRGTTHKLLGSTYSSGTPTLFSSSLLPGLETALIGQKAGSRVLAVIPPAEGFGASGNSQIGVSGTDTLVFVVDMLQEVNNAAGVSGTQTSNGGGALPTVTAASGKAPTITIPATKPPATLQVKTLIKGTGAKVTKGQLVVVQYTGVNWRTKKVFDSSWSRGMPFGVNIGEGQVIKGWDTGLIGQTVGSRVLLVIPPSQGYGASGSSQAGIKGTDTLVFVVDIVAAKGA